MSAQLFQNSIPPFENSVDPDQLASDEASCSGSTLSHPHDASILLVKLTLCILEIPKGFFLANSEDPDEMPQNRALHQGLHCLLR